MDGVAFQAVAGAKPSDGGQRVAFEMHAAIEIGLGLDGGQELPDQRADRCLPRGGCDSSAPIHLVGQ